MNAALFAGAVRLLCAALLMLLFAASASSAASWRWSIASSGRERLQITLDAPDVDLTVSRTGTHSLSVNLTKPSQFSAQSAPEQTKLFTGAVQQGMQIELSLSTQAFGYIVLRPTPIQVLVDVYPDPLGTRWRPPSTHAAATDETRTALPTAPAGLIGAVFSQAYAASPGTAPSVGERNAQISPQAIRADINKAGPEAWPSNKALFSGPVNPQAVSASAASPATPAAAPSAQGSSISAPMGPPPGTGGPVVSAPVTLPPAAQGTAGPSPALSGPAVPPSAARTPAVMPPLPPEAPVSLPPLPQELQKPASPQLPPLPQTQQAQQQPAAAPPQETGQAPQTPPGSENEGTQVMGQVRATQQPSTNATQVSANATAPVVYVDEKGNPVPKPLDPVELMAQVSAYMGQKDYRAALETLATLKGMPLPRDQKEKVLYLISDATWELYKDKPLEGYERILAATNEAMNANLRSPNVPGAMVRLGEANLLVGNVREAEAYFSARRSAYPPSPEVPISLLKLGLAQLQAKQYAKAAKVFRDIIQHFPESPALEKASVSL
ncbi:MAG: tetratricopeptide repeat protein, partial [Deltaproteobacteria bacterium]|nr:tetratricopeptide repeat protein [Deltaproteobacteria bacterium]